MSPHTEFLLLAFRHIAALWPLRSSSAKVEQIVSFRMNALALLERAAWDKLPGLVLGPALTEQLQIKGV